MCKQCDKEVRDLLARLNEALEEIHAMIGYYDRKPGLEIVSAIYSGEALGLSQAIEIVKKMT